MWGYGTTADVVVAPPFVYIDQVKNSLTERIEVSAQNVWIGKGGAYTGEIRLGTGLLRVETHCPFNFFSIHGNCSYFYSNCNKSSVLLYFYYWMNFVW